MLLACCGPPRYVILTQIPAKQMLGKHGATPLRNLNAYRLNGACLDFYTFLLTPSSSLVWEMDFVLRGSPNTKHFYVAAEVVRLARVKRQNRPGEKE
jgi:hypothetical protein